MNRVEEFLQLLLAASEVRREGALSVLRGHAQAVEPGSQPMTFEPLLTRAEAARRLGVTRQTLRLWKVPSTAAIGRKRFRLSQIEAYLASEEFQRRRAALRGSRKSAKAATPAPSPTPFDDGIQRPGRRQRTMKAHSNNQ